MIDVSPELLGNYCYMIKNLIFKVVAIAQIAQNCWILGMVLSILQ